MKDYIIMTDSSCDLSEKTINDLKVSYLGLVCNYKGKEIIEDCGKSLDYKTFYNGIREGEIPSTAQINSYRFVQEFKKHINEGRSILYIAFSSALSGTYNSSLLAREEILEEYPNADITIIDSKAASMGVGLLVHYACKLKNEGKDKEFVASWIQENKYKLCSFFTVDDLMHLKRGGRISTTTAAVGSILNIKPILYVDKEGRLQSFSKAKGNKKALRALADQFEKHAIDPQNQTIFISHSDNLEGAESLALTLKEKFNVKEIEINYIGLAIGSHTGTGTIALFFLGNRD